MEAPGGTDVLFCLHNRFIRVLRMKCATLEVLQIAKVTKTLRAAKSSVHINCTFSGGVYRLPIVCQIPHRLIVGQFLPGLPPRWTVYGMRSGGHPRLEDIN